MLNTELPPKKYSDIGEWAQDFSAKSSFLGNRIAKLLAERQDLNNEEKFALAKAQQVLESSIVKAIVDTENELGEAATKITQLLPLDLIECRIGKTVFPCVSV